MLFKILIKNMLKHGEERKSALMFIQIFKIRYDEIENKIGKYKQLKNKIIEKELSITYNIVQSFENSEESLLDLEK